MKIRRSRYYLGGIGVLLLLMAGTLWAVAAMASPSAQTEGIIEFVDDTHVASEVGEVGDRTIKVRVTDPDVNILIPVGGEDNDDRTITLTIEKEADGDDKVVDVRFVNVLLVDISQVKGVYIGSGSVGSVAGVGEATQPIIGDVTIDYDKSKGIGTEKKPDVEVIGVRTRGDIQLVDLRVNDSLFDGDEIVLNYNTSDEEGTLAVVKGDGDAMYLGLREGSTHGEYEGDFVVSNSVSISIDDIKGEQYAVPAGLQSGRTITDTLEVPEKTGAEKYVDTETFDIPVSNPNIRDGLDDKDGLTIADVEVESGNVRIVNLLDSSGGTLKSGEKAVAVRFEARGDVSVGSNVRISYKGDDRFTITLEHGPAQSKVTTNSLDAFITSAFTVPQPGSFDNLYEVRGDKSGTIDPTITFSVNKNTPSTGTVIGVDYRGTEELTLDASVDAGATFDLMTNAAADGAPATVKILSGVGVAQYLDATKTKRTDDTDDGDNNYTFTVFPSNTKGKDLKLGDSFFVHYAKMNMDAGFNPEGALDAKGSPRPVVRAASAIDVDEITATYDDATYGKVSASVTVEDLKPAFSDVQPGDKSSFTTSKVPTLSIVISDLPDADPAGIDTDTIRFYVTLNETPATWDSATAGTLPKTAGKVVYATADISTDDLGVVTASLPLADDADKRLAGFDDLTEATKATTVRWWVTATDEIGNIATTDAVEDDDDKTTTEDEGNQPYTLSVDSSAPDADEAVTGEWYDSEDKETKMNRKNSIRIEFNEGLDADSVDADDFVVTVGGDEVAVSSASVQGVDVFLTLAEDLAPDATAKISVANTGDRVTDKAGNMLATGELVDVKDGIAPTISVTLSTGVADEKLDVVVSTDEDIINVPTLNLYNSDMGKVSSAKVSRPERTSGGANEWTFTVDPDANAIYSIVVTAFDDISRPRNQGTTGNKDHEDDDAITFEIDNKLAAPADDNFDPGPDDLVGESAFTFIEFTWNDEKEYTGDSYDDVTLTTLVLDSGDDNERDLLAQAAPEGAATKFSVAVADIGIGKHTLFVNAEDSAGNDLGDAREVEFEVTKVVISLDLKRGISHISIPRNPQDRDINAVFGDAMEVQTVFTFDGGEPLAAFRDPATGAFVGSLKNIDAGHAYGVEVTDSVKVEIAVPPLSGGGTPPSVSVDKGWNFVPVITLDDLNDAKQGTVLDADAYLGYNWTSGWTFQSSRWYQIQPDPKNEEIADDDSQGKGEVLVGSGYWVYFVADDTLTPGTLYDHPTVTTN